MNAEREQWALECLERIEQHLRAIKACLIIALIVVPAVAALILVTTAG